jgi:hypothetical protein
MHMLSPLRGQYFNMGVTASINNASTVNANRIYLVPIFVRRPTLIDRLAIQVTTGVAGATLRLALYRQIPENGVDGEAGWPLEPIYQSIDLPAATTNAIAETELSFTLQPDQMYWGGFWPSAGIGIRTLPTNNQPMIMSNGAAALTGIGSIWRTLTYAGGSWPSPWGAAVASELIAAQNQAVPCINWRCPP